jgi:hypothetical protein
MAVLLLSRQKGKKRNHSPDLISLVQSTKYCPHITLRMDCKHPGSVFGDRSDYMFLYYGILGSRHHPEIAIPNYI